MGLRHLLGYGFIIMGAAVTLLFLIFMLRGNEFNHSFLMTLLYGAISCFLTGGLVLKTSE